MSNQDDLYVQETYPSRFVKGSELPQEGEKVRIHQVTREELKNFNGQLQNKFILHLVNHEPPEAALNKTQSEDLARFFGEPANKCWPGKVVLMVPEKLKSGQITIKFFPVADSQGPQQPEAPPVDLDQAPPADEELGD